MAFFSHQPFSGFQLSFLFRISALNIKDFTRKFVILSLKKSDNLFLSSTFFRISAFPFYTLLSTLITVNTTYPFYFFLLHHCTNRLSPLHIFVHHCTFCASLHVKTSPGPLDYDFVINPASSYTYYRPYNIILSFQDLLTQEFFL